MITNSASPAGGRPGPTSCRPNSRSVKRDARTDGRSLGWTFDSRVYRASQTSESGLTCVSTNNNDHDEEHRCPAANAQLLAKLGVRDPNGRGTVLAKRSARKAGRPRCSLRTSVSRMYAATRVALTEARLRLHGLRRRRRRELSDLARQSDHRAVGRRRSGRLPWARSRAALALSARLSGPRSQNRSVRELELRVARSSEPSQPSR